MSVLDSSEASAVDDIHAAQELRTGILVIFNFVHISKAI